MTSDDLRAPATAAAPVLTSTSHIALMARPFGAPRIHMDEDAMSHTSSAVTPFVSVNPLPADAPAEFSTATKASAYLADLRGKRAKAASEKPAVQAGVDTSNNTAESAESATADNELSGEDNAAADQNQPTGETQEADPADKQPPLELPRSWAKEQLAHWNALPRETQEFVIAQASKDSEAVRRAQNETAAERKALEAQRAQAEQTRTAAEEQAKSALKILEREQLRDFPDIRSQDDLNKLNAQLSHLRRQSAALSATDPFNAGELRGQADLIQDYLARWASHQEEMRAQADLVKKAEDRKVAETQTEARDRKARENKMLIEKAPEFADPKKLEAAQVAAAQLFRDLGYSDEELVKLGSEPLLDDHRIQLIINDAMKYRAAKATSPKVVAKPVPPVQRPGTSKPPGSGDSATIQALTRKFETSGDIKDAVALRLAKSRAAARR